MRIFIDPGTYHCLNMGDVAMLQVAVRRLSSLFPGAVLSCVTAAPDLLARYCPGVRPVGCRVRSAFLQEEVLLGPLGRRLRGPLLRSLVRCEGLVRRRRPSFMAALLSVKSRLRGWNSLDFHSFVDLLLGSDMAVVSGCGGLNDAFSDHAKSILEILAVAQAHNIPTVLFGQGVGPISDPSLTEAARRVLPRAQLIALRESRSGPALLESLQVPSKCITVTGDDAVEMAFDARPASLGGAIGINLRVASYSSVDRALIGPLSKVLHSSARMLSAPLLPVPISSHRDDSDGQALQELLAGYERLPGSDEPLDSPISVIRQVGRCRVMISGSYHGAVFALSQGIPAVALAKSRYYLDKFLGLAGQFGAGCQMVLLEGDDLQPKIQDAVLAAWNSAPDLRAQLLQAACRQIDSARSAYVKVKAGVATTGVLE